jgi:3-oxoacyl-[acyl-carrier protein] reductase
MTTIVLGPAEALSAALTDEVGSVVVIEGIGATLGVTAPEWPGLVDDTMWQALLALQTAHSSMAARGGRIVLILPTIGTAGAAGLVGYTTAIEGIRAMAKSAARQWGSEGIAVNMVAAPARIFAPTLATSDAHLSAAAVQDDSTLIDSIVATARFLLRRDVTHLSGQTVIVDGGSVMLP